MALAAAWQERGETPVRKVVPVPQPGVDREVAPPSETTGRQRDCYSAAKTSRGAAPGRAPAAKSQPSAARRNGGADPGASATQDENQAQ